MVMTGKPAGLGMKHFAYLVQASITNLRCPACQRDGAFAAPNQGEISAPDAVFLEQTASDPGARSITKALVWSYGIRVCPNLQCREPIVVLFREGKIYASLPAETISFDRTGVPHAILESFSEAVICHANRCFRAAAIMVRRTLEEICQERGATGGNLKDRIAKLGERVVLPKELIEAADELRLLGNDAAHMEARVYDDVGEEEVEAGIALCKEILKGVYQLSDLVDRLRKLRAQKPR